MRRSSVFVAAAGCVLIGSLVLGECMHPPRAVPAPAGPQPDEAATPEEMMPSPGDPEESTWPCPEPWDELAVERRGVDEQGRRTWWHADGSITRLTVETDEQGLEVQNVEHIPHGR